MDYSFISNAHPQYIEDLYEKYSKDPMSVVEGWREFFYGYQYAMQDAGQNGTINAPNLSTKDLAVLRLIEAYRHRAHLISTTNPIRPRKNRLAGLDLSYFSLSEADLQTTFMAGSELGLSNATLSQIIDRLNTIYAGNIGFEFSHIENQDKYEWLKNKIEKRSGSDYGLSIEKKKRILEKLNGATGFENFLAKNMSPKTVWFRRWRIDYSGSRCYH